MKLINKIQSKLDSTQKFVFELNDGARVEFSYINKGDGKDIICVPSQTSCKMGCKFCFLTTHGKDLPCRNLWGIEIEDGVNYIANEINLQEKILLISVMGAGEPLNNIEPIWAFVDQIKRKYTSDKREVRFALATLLPKAKESVFLDLIGWVLEGKIPLKVHLSLHFTDDVTRKEYLPSAADIKTSISLLETYHRVTGNPVEIHYTLIDNVNDRWRDIDLLEELLKTRDIPVKVLAYSENPSTEDVASSFAKVFARELEKWEIKAESYTPPGSDIGASCGQFNIADLKPI